LEATSYDSFGLLLHKVTLPHDRDVTGRLVGGFATASEQFGAYAPFLKRSMIRDSLRRGYMIRPGGDVVRMDKHWDRTRRECLA
jgi:hypothetical protein